MSNLENCPICKKLISINAELCPSCGEPFTEGWALKIREERSKEQLEIELKEDRERIEEEATKKKIKNFEINKRQKKRKFWTIAIIFFLGILFLPKIIDSYKLNNLKENDPKEYQKVMAERKAKVEAEKQKEINELEAIVAKVPASNFKKNIELYKELSELNPINKKYIEKIKFYESKKRAYENERRAKERKEAEQVEINKRRNVAEKRRKGFHCLSGWDGAHSVFERHVQSQMRDPDSFEHIETKITPVNEKGNHTLIMKYRARNGFGGMTVGEALATIKNSDCSATPLSIN